MVKPYMEYYVTIEQYAAYVLIWNNKQTAHSLGHANICLKNKNNKIYMCVKFIQD